MQVAVLDFCSQITDGAGYVVLVIVGWDCKVMREKGNSVGDSFSPGSRDVCLVTVVVVWAVPNISSIETILSPSFALLWSFINYCFYSRCYHGRGVVIKWAIQVCEVRHMGVEAGGAQHVEGILTLRQNTARKVQREIWVHGAYARNKMTLEGVNAFFSWVGAVIMGLHKFQFVLVLINNNFL